MARHDMADAGPGVEPALQGRELRRRIGHADQRKADGRLQQSPTFMAADRAEVVYPAELNALRTPQGAVDSDGPKESLRGAGHDRPETRKFQKGHYANEYYRNRQGRHD